MNGTGKRRLTLVLAVLTAAVLVISIPGSLRDAWQRGGFYVFSQEFLTDLPLRLTGPGHMRFVLQPAMATALGIAAGLADRRARRPPYLRGILSDGAARHELLRSGARNVVNLVLAGVLVDAVCQWILLGVSYPAAALIVGPVLVTTPYAVSRSLANRFAGLGSRRPAG
jgi:hypothetical protein